MIKEHKDFLCFLVKKFGKTPFSYEEAKEYLTKEEKFTNQDFSKYWNKSYLLKDDTYIQRVQNSNTYILTYKSLTLVQEVEKLPWTHAEIISIISVIASCITTLMVAILGVLCNV